MRALVLRGPWDIGPETRDDPEPRRGEVLVRVTATGICGSDIHGFTGESGRRHIGQIMGHETVGRVVALGEGLDPRAGVAPGAVATINPVVGCGSCPRCDAGEPQSCAARRVIGVTEGIDAAFADLVAAPAGNVVTLPEEMPDEYGALIEPLAVGYHAARRGHCAPEDAVLVIGGGPIGQACALAARRIGARGLVVSEPNPERRGLLTDLGVPAFDPTTDNLPREVPGELGGTPTLVLDAVGTTASVADAFACTAPGARVVLVGMNSPGIELSAYAVSTGERTLIGSFCYSSAEFHRTAEWVGSAPPALARLIEGRTDLDGAGDAFTRLANGEWSASKVLVLPNAAPRPTGRPTGQ